MEETGTTHKHRRKERKLLTEFSQSLFILKDAEGFKRIQGFDCSELDTYTVYNNNTNPLNSTCELKLWKEDTAALSTLKFCSITTLWGWVCCYRMIGMDTSTEAWQLRAPPHEITHNTDPAQSFSLDCHICAIESNPVCSCSTLFFNYTHMTTTDSSMPTGVQPHLASNLFNHPSLIKTLGVCDDVNMELIETSAAMSCIYKSASSSSEW